MTEEELCEATARKFVCKEYCERYHNTQKYWQDGAEFGYNKANEWHFVKDEDLPKDEEYKWCVSPSGYPYIARYEELFVSWTNQENKEVCCPYAWKEIVLPELPKEGE